MDEAAGDVGHSESNALNQQWLQTRIIDRVQSIDLRSEDVSGVRIPTAREEEVSAKWASQILWETGEYACKIPNGFYSVNPDQRLKARYTTVPTLDELSALASEGIRADPILVDAEKDKRVAKLKQYTIASVKGLSSNATLAIKKIAEVVCEFYGGPHVEAGPSKLSAEEMFSFSENQGVILLGQMKNKSCRPRALLFKVLADAVGLRSKLLTGLQTYDKGITYSDSCKHMSVLVSLNSTELIVDVMKCPGQLIPFSVRSLVIYHLSGTGESDSAENDSCDSPLEPNSPMFGCSDKLGNESPEPDDSSPRCMDPSRGENLPTVAGPSLPNIKLRPISGCVEGKLSLSRSEPDIVNGLWRRSRRKVIAEHRTASSSPEHRFMRTRGRSVLSGHRHSFVDDAESVSPSSADQSPQHNVVLERSSTGVERQSPHAVKSHDEKERSEHISKLETRRIRKRSVSIAPEISDDIVRAVRAMNEALKQERQVRLVKAQQTFQGERRSLFLEKGQTSSAHKSENVSESLTNNRNLAVEKLAESGASKDLNETLTQPTTVHSSPQGAQEREAAIHSNNLNQLNEVLNASSHLSQPLLPFPEWHIDFSELRIGVRVGIGSFGEVFRGIWRGTEVAIKVLLEQDLTRENIEDFCNEIQLLSRMRHPNVILFLGACTKPPHLSMVTEYMEMGSLYYLIHASGQGKKLSWRRRLKMLRDICRGMMSIQRMNIVHRDLKSANCLVDKHWTVKICDFGLSRVMTDLPIRDPVAAGTPEWMAPELLRNEPFTDKCDVFSLGVIIWELCTLQCPWKVVKPMQVVYAVAHEGARLEIPEGPIGKLIADCWADADERPSYEEIFTRLHECEFLMS
eukprot:TRINITY_DN9886_c0_g1_i1.p1 TRINITY_DN9886_c0_g1~~TRINITY_DN9886_c0_g1_i1.p1  ORF type:complete len:856 (-),score=182.72 TRINITY_DN9886_c0_g1_i1:397-2964(-)